MRSQTLSPVFRRRAAAVALVAALTAGAGLTACATNPATGRPQVMLISDDALNQAGEEAWRQQLATQRVSRDAAQNAQLKRVADRVVQAAGVRDRYNWEYAVFDDQSANAFVLPGGKIGVNAGLLRMVQNDDQLAAVLGHEVGHVTARHAAERYSQVAVAQVGLGALGDRRVLQQVLGVGAQLGVMSYNRRHELEADRLGVDYMQRAGYRPREAVTLWRNMAAGRTGGRPPEFLSTHPSDETRIRELEAYIQSRGW